MGLGQSEGVLQAGGSFQGSLGAGAVSRYQRGGIAARTGVGVYTVTLDQPLNAADGELRATPRGGAAQANAQVAHTSDTVKTVTLFVAAVATDVDFDWIASKVTHGLA